MTVQELIQWLQKFADPEAEVETIMHDLDGFDHLTHKRVPFDPVQHIKCDCTRRAVILDGNGF